MVRRIVFFLLSLVFSGCAAKLPEPAPPRPCLERQPADQVNFATYYDIGPVDLMDASGRKVTALRFDMEPNSAKEFFDWVIELQKTARAAAKCVEPSLRPTARP